MEVHGEEDEKTLYPRKVEFAKCLMHLQLALKEASEIPDNELTSATSKLERVMCLHFQIHEPVQGLTFPENEEKCKAAFTAWMQGEDLKKLTAQVKKSVCDLRTRVITVLDKQLEPATVTLKEVALGCSDGGNWKSKLTEPFTWADCKKVASTTLLTDNMCKALTSRFKNLKKE